MSISEAKKKANAKYDDKNYKKFTTKWKIEELAAIDDYIAQFEDVPRSRFLLWAARYFVDSGTLPPEPEALPRD